MRAAALCCSSLALLGCEFSGSGAPSDAGPDGPVDVPGDVAPDVACTSFASHVDTCVLAFGPSLELTRSAVFDTDTLTLTTENGASQVTVAHVTTTTNGVEVGALLVDRLEIGPMVTLRGVGSRPFAIVSRGEVIFRNSAVISVAAGGAGARPECEGGAKRGENTNGGAAGGGGGGFGGHGARGGNGNSDGGFGNQSSGGARGEMQPMPTGPLGGCPGAGGGDGASGGGGGGAGGGAVYLVSATSFELYPGAGIDAGGAGGEGGGQAGNNYGDAGGGGGGSGGMILVEAPRVSGGIFAANGGGGGEGSGDRVAGQRGEAGQMDAEPARGGGFLDQPAPSPTGADGGAGGAGAIVDGASPTQVQQGGGGGGGGGVGYVRILSPDASPDLVSPASTLP